jgi:hypothetical protein
VVEYVLGRPWQTDYSTLDPSVSFLIAQGNRGMAGGSRARAREAASSSREGQKGAKPSEVTMTFQPWFKAQAVEYQSLSSVPAAMEKMSPHPVLTPTPPPTGRSVRQLRDLAWGGRRGGGKEAAALEETERVRVRLEENEKRKTRQRRERREKVDTELGRTGEDDRYPVEEYPSGKDVDRLPPWGYQRHYYSFHTDCAIQIQALARGVESRKKVSFSLFLSLCVCVFVCVF